MTNHEFFNNYANELKANGFEVYVNAKTQKPTYAFIVKDDKIGYMQIGDFGGISFSTVHKPTKNIGTGFGLGEGNNFDRAIYNPTIQDAEKTFIIAPNWASERDFKDVVKFKNWAEYISRETILSYKSF